MESLISTYAQMVRFIMVDGIIPVYYLYVRKMNQSAKIIRQRSGRVLTYGLSVCEGHHVMTYKSSGVIRIYRSAIGMICVCVCLCSTSGDRIKESVVLCPLAKHWLLKK